MKDVYFNALSDNLITLRFTRYKLFATQLNLEIK